MLLPNVGRVVIAFLLSGFLTGNGAAGELVSNPTFSTADEDGVPAAWPVWKPVWTKAACSIRCTEEGLLMGAAGSPYAVGGVVQQVGNIKGGKAYRIEATCKVRNVPDPYGSLFVRVTWTQGGRLIHPAGMLVRGPSIEGGIARFKDILLAPDDADGARLSLEAKWLRGGSVLWRSVSVQAAPAPVPREVKVGTVYLRPQRSTPQRNLELFCEQVDRAGKLGLDIVCLGEAITLVGTGRSVAECAERIPGPVTKKLGEAARRNKIWVIAGLTELDGDDVYNTAVLFDRQGRVSGKYRKVHLPREEWKNGIRPGDSYPVFRTDFGTIAIQICYDWFFPEAEAIFALKGAEIIFAPTWGNTLPDEDGCVNGETVFRVRARDNGVYMVPSVYDGNSMVVDPMGRILASSNAEEGVVWAKADLNRREALRWVGYWRSIGPRHRIPSTYGPLLETLSQPTY